MQLFQAPAAFHELDCQPIEQLGVRRRFALHAEILTGGHQTRAEIGLPDAIDDSSRRRRRTPIDQPAGEGQTIVGIVRRQRVQERRHARSHALGRLEKVAAFEDMRFARLLPR